VFIVEHYFVSKYLATAREALTKAYPGKKVESKTTIHQLVTIWGKWEVSVCVTSDKTAEITAVPISSIASVATTGYGCKGSCAVPTVAV
jgi:hypothetical protein